MEQQIIQLYQEGYSITNISKKIQKRKSYVSDVLKNSDVKIRTRGGKRKPLTQSQKFEICTYFNEGLTIQEISNKIGISWNGVKKVLIEYNLYEVTRPDITEDQIKQINDLYDSGLSSREVADKLEISKWSVLKYAEEIREPSTHRLYNADFSYFDNIDNQDKAYWLGVLFADGYNNEDRGQVKLGQAVKDKQLVYWFKHALRAENPVSIVTFNNKRTDFYTLGINNQHFSQSLAKHGCIQNKTLNLQFPDIDESLYSHFIRGYFDGDGSVWNSGGYHISFTGTKQFLTRVQEILMKECNLNKTKLSSYKGRCNDSIVDIRYGGNRQVKRIKDYLYKDANYLNLRKFNKFKNLT